MQPSHIKYRVFAFLIDFAVIAIMAVLVVFFGQIYPIIRTIVKTITENSENLPNISTYAVYKILQCGVILEILVAFYLTFIPLSVFKGQTIGMRLFKIKVVSFSGQNAAGGQIFVRQTLCLALLPIITLGLSLLVDLIVSVYRHDNLSLTDTISKTRVVDKLDY